jgi:hypothetical protein
MPKVGHVYKAKDAATNWELWHKRYGHISYSGLKRLHNEKMVDGFTVDINSPTLDCTACTEAKQHIEPFNKAKKCELEPGKLTHIDLWGKYDILSVNRNQYYIVMVDDATRMMTVNFSKMKDQVSQVVKDYMVYLKTRGQHPKAMCTDHSKEFINDKLSAWCCE